MGQVQYMKSELVWSGHTTITYLRLANDIARKSNKTTTGHKAKQTAPSEQADHKIRKGHKAPHYKNKRDKHRIQTMGAITVNKPRTAEPLLESRQQPKSQGA